MITTLDYSNKRNYTFTGDVNDSIFKPLGFKGNANPTNGFSDELYDFYWSKQDYENAARYSSMFNYKDVREELKHKAWVRETREIAKQRNAIFNSLQNDDERDLLEFSSSVFNGDAFSTIDIRNPYVKRYNKIFSNIGTDIEGTKPTTLSVTFGSDKSSFLGLFDMDNDNSFSAFLENAKYTEDFFNKGGRHLSKTDGKRTITFDPNSSEGRQILYNLAKYSTNSSILPGDKELEIRGYDSQGNLLNNPNTQIRTNFGDLGGQYNTKSIYLLKELANIVDDATLKEEEITNRTLNRVYSTNLYGAESADIAEAEKAVVMAPDEQTRASAKERLKTLQAHTKQLMVGVGLSQKRVVSNYGNKEGDETMREMGSGNIDALKQLITQAWSDGNLSYQLAESNGKFGCYVTIPATTKKGFGNPDGDEQRAINIFIENFLSDKAQEAVAADTQYAAIHELDQMEAWGYGYDLSDGRKIEVERTGNDKEITIFNLVDKDGTSRQSDKKELVKILNADKIKQEGAYELYRKYVNINGDVIDSKALDDHMKKMATYIANNFYPDIEPIIDFERAFSLTSNDKLKLSFEMFDKIQAMEQAYTDILTQFQLLQ